MASSSTTPFQVFISHAGNDKTTMAIPLREKLQHLGITAFVDETDMPPGADAIQEMTKAMETATVGVIILSPEFVAREWPMKELLCFLRRRRAALDNGERYPVVIPIFYRLSVKELYSVPRLFRRRSIIRASRFRQLRNNADPEADIETIKAALREVHGIVGVRNDIGATNSSDLEMSERRDFILQRTCRFIAEALPNHQEETQERDSEPGAENMATSENRIADPVPHWLTMLRGFISYFPNFLYSRETEVPALVLIGCHGAGKSTILNGFVGEPIFRTDGERFHSRERSERYDSPLLRTPEPCLGEHVHNGIKLYDTPGVDMYGRPSQVLEDLFSQKVALKIAFVVDYRIYEDPSYVVQQSWLIRSILATIRENTNNSFGVIVNKVPEHELQNLRMYPTYEQEIRSGLIRSRSTSHWCHVRMRDDLEGKGNGMLMTPELRHFLQTLPVTKSKNAKVDPIGVTRHILPTVSLWERNCIIA